MAVEPWITVKIHPLGCGRCAIRPACGRRGYLGLLAGSDDVCPFFSIGKMIKMIESDDMEGMRR